MNSFFFIRVFPLCLLLMGGCSGLLPKAPPQPSFYSFEGLRLTESSVPRGSEANGAASAAVVAPTLIVSPPQAAAGFDSARIIYVRKVHQLGYFAHSEWVDTPARMMAPLIVDAVLQRNAFAAVVSMQSTAAGDMRLDTELLRLEQDFEASPSRVRLTLRATIVDSVTRRVIAWREFDESADAPSEDAYGGVVAANRALQKVLAGLADACVEAARGWKATQANLSSNAQSQVLRR